MKRIFTWLILPLVLFALVMGVKWRAEHPTPTKADLEIRDLLSKAVDGEVIHHPPRSKKGKEYSVVLSRDELKPFIDSFYVSSVPPKRHGIQMGASGALSFGCLLPKRRKDGVWGVSVSISIDKREGKVVGAHPDNNVEQELHPVTVKKWLDLLLNHPSVGAQMRARL